MHSTRALIDAVHLTPVADRKVAELAHGQQRQLEIALALAGAPRFILVNEPAAGLSPTERRELIEILTSLPQHIGYIIIEHDMDVALRVVESVTMMHNNRIFTEGTPEEIESDPRCRSFIWEAGMAEPRAGAPILEVRGLDVYYGRSHALQGVDLTLTSGVLSVVGRNGMGKTTLCKTIMGLVPVTGGSVRLSGEDITNSAPAHVARLGVGYVPQGRRLWRSLTIDEHLKMTSGLRRGAWTVERIYQTFPRLAERKNNGGGQLSGGEQQMLAISRALLTNPKLLVMDEPTEGPAPVIVAQVEDMLIRLGEEGDIAVLAIEQNIGVATAVARDVAIMVNSRVNRMIESARQVSDRELQQRLLGVGRHSDTPDEAGPIQRSADPRVCFQPRPADPLVATHSDPPHRGGRA